MLKITLLASLALLLTVGFAQPTYYEVLRTVDADTLIVTVGDTAERVRLLSVDAPETYRKPEPFGLEATAFVKELLAGRQVRLEYGPQLRDQYGRLLAYVFLPDGRDVSLLLAQEGLARLDVREPNTEHADLYTAAVAGAKAAKKGMWRDAPESRRKWRCSSFGTQAEAQNFFLGAQSEMKRDAFNLDANKDEVACQSLPKGKLLTFVASGL